MTGQLGRCDTVGCQRQPGVPSSDAVLRARFTNCFTITTKAPNKLQFAIITVPYTTSARGTSAECCRPTTNGDSARLRGNPSTICISVRDMYPSPVAPGSFVFDNIQRASQAIIAKPPPMPAPFATARVILGLPRRHGGRTSELALASGRSNGPSETPGPSHECSIVTIHGSAPPAPGRAECWRRHSSNRSAWVPVRTNVSSSATTR